MTAEVRSLYAEKIFGDLCFAPDPDFKEATRITLAPLFGNGWALSGQRRKEDSEGREGRRRGVRSVAWFQKTWTLILCFMVFCISLVIDTEVRGCLLV